MAFHAGFCADYLNPLQVQTEIGAIVAEFPALCRLETLRHKSHGYHGAKVEARGQHEMQVLRITASGDSQSRPAVLLMRSHHAREWINALAIVETARQLVENYRPQDADPAVRQVVAMLNEVEFLIVPESNPDGARLTFFDAGQRMWRKNLRPPAAGGCAGVDCNRNFPRYFGESGSSATPCTEIYRGPAPLSEPEAANIAELVARERGILFAIDSHSHGQAIFRPSPSGGTFISSLPVSPADESIYQHLEAAINRGIKRVQGVEYSTGSTSNHAGTTDEYLFFDHHIFAFDLECGQDFQPAIDAAKLAAREVAEAVRALGWCAAGMSGLDINMLLAQRAPITDSNAPPTKVSRRAAPWKVERLPEEQWRRFSVRCPAKNPLRIASEAQELLNRGFDLEFEAVGANALEIVASSADLVELVRVGYQPVIQSDLYANVEK